MKYTCHSCDKYNREYRYVLNGPLFYPLKAFGL